MKRPDSFGIIHLKLLMLVTAVLLTACGSSECSESVKPETTSSSHRPNIILIMTDDQGWGQTGYYNHPVLKTPNLDAMAANGLRFDRFYAGAPVCSPTRASVLTGRSNDRTGVFNHGHALRLQEKTLPMALRNAGYATGHFGKWHLDGIRGPGIPIFADDTHHPGKFGFDEWLSVTNFFDINPLMSRKGEFVEFKGDSSSIIVNEALSFIRETLETEKPFFAVIWDGSPHDPFRASAADRSAFQHLDQRSQHHYGELVAFDRSLGVLRKSLRDLGIEKDTIVWFCSDNGGLNNLNPGSVGNLRGYKGTVYEGGLRVPAVLEWPGKIFPRVTSYPASTMDIFPTITEILDLPESSMQIPVDGTSLAQLMEDDLPRRSVPIPFKRLNTGAYVDNDYKLLSTDLKNKTYELYNLIEDPSEAFNLANTQPEALLDLRRKYENWLTSVEASRSGMDYPEGKVYDDEPEPIIWMRDKRFAPYFDEWSKRPEYKSRIEQGR